MHRQSLFIYNEGRCRNLKRGSRSVVLVIAGNGVALFIWSAGMASFGEDLRRERELRGFTLREISDTTKISIRFLEALENNDFKHLPGGQFNKGFVRAFATHIGLDPEKMVNSYLLEVSRQENQKRSHMKCAPAPEKKKLDMRLLTVIIIIVAVTFACAAVLLYLWLRGPAKGSQEKSNSTPNSDSAVVQSYAVSSSAKQSGEDSSSSFTDGRT